MFFANVLKKPIYIAARSVNDDGVAVFAEPIEYDVNCYNTLPASASAELESLGASFSDYRQIVGDTDYLSQVHELDRVWVEQPKPTKSDPMGKTADFYVSALPARYPNVTKVLLKRLTNDH